MIRLIEALNYRCLRYVRQPMGPFHVLVGPNASGKTTFLDVIAFLGQLVYEGLEAAINSRSSNPRDLVWNHEGDRFELAIELAIPNSLQERLQTQFDTVRYEVEIGPDSKTQQIGIVREAVLLRNFSASDGVMRYNSTAGNRRRDSIITSECQNDIKFIFYSNLGSIKFSETLENEIKHESDWPWVKSLNSNSFLSLLFAVDNLENICGPFFPAALLVRRFLTNNIHTLSLNSFSIRKPSPPGQGIKFKPDGSNLPLVVEKLKEQNEDRFRDWIAHLRTALPDLVDIEVIDRPEDRHRWLRLCYQGDLRVPSWMVSDGTLRLLALTLPAYLPDLEGVFLVEEPENGIHPRAIETMVQSLRSVYGAQVLLATHSPVVLGVTSPDEVLCFDRMKDGSTNIVLGSEHPALRNWQHDTDLGSLFAAGVLG